MLNNRKNRVFMCFLLAVFVCISSMNINPLVSVAASDMDDATFDTRVADFISDSRWKNGISWGYHHEPEISTYKAIGCCAYATDFAKYVYGANSIKAGGDKYTDIDEIRKGDIVYMKPDHWLIILDREDDLLYTAEGNINSKVRIKNGSSAGWKIDGDYLVMLDGSKRPEKRTFSAGYHFYFDPTTPVYTPPVYEDVFTLGETTDIKDTTVRINVTFNVKARSKEVGFYIGSSEKTLKRKRTSSRSKVRESIYFDLGDGELIDALTPATTYYFCFYAVIGGREYRSEVGSFLTEGVPAEDYAGWVRDSGGLWYKQKKGSYLRNCKRKIDGIVWYFDNMGYAHTECEVETAE